MLRRSGGGARASGHNMLEMVLAVCLFATVVVGLISVWSTYARSIAKARSVLVATYLGEELMENCIAARYDNIVLFANGYPSPNPPPGDPRGAAARATSEADIRSISTRALIRGREVQTHYKVWVDLGAPVVTAGGSIVPVTVCVEWLEKQATELSDTRNASGEVAKARNLKFNTLISSSS